MTEVEKAIARILGMTPAFKGLKEKRQTDTKIVIKADKVMQEKQVRMCDASVVGETANLSKALNQG